jgi:hypothetical protein
MNTKLKTAYCAVAYPVKFFVYSLLPGGLWSSSGRQLIVGKYRRMFQSLSAQRVAELKARDGIQNGCSQCGTSCQLLFTCPGFDKETKNCTIYPYRPQVCRDFPITARDIEDRNLVNPDQGCGFTSSQI